MRDYEMTVLIKADLSEKDLDKEIKSLQTMLEKGKAKIKSKKDAEKKLMTYEIGHARQANYVFMEVSADPAEIAGFEQKMKVNDNIIRYMTIVKPD